MAYESELTAADVKAKAKECGADIVGIAPVSRWEETDKQHDPRYIFPSAKSMIVMGFRKPGWTQWKVADYGAAGVRALPSPVGGAPCRRSFN